MAVSCQKKHIIILCSRLDLAGGIERAIVNTANLFQQHENKVCLLVLDISCESFYPLHPAIDIIQKDLNFGITEEGNFFSRKAKLLKNIRSLRQVLTQFQPDFIIGTEYQFSIAARLATKKSLAKVFAWEHHHFFWLRRSFFWQTLFKSIYPKMNCVICLNNREQQLFNSIGCATTVIPNFIEKNIKSKTSAKIILTVGWLIKRKGVDMIPLIAKKVFSKYPEWKWNIIGASTPEVDLKKTVQEIGLANHINIFAPASSNLSEIYRQASIYVMTSRFECFPMVLLEAMSFGIPCISFDCPTGPSDIIREGKDGMLVEKENTEAMANAIIELIENEEKRKQMGANAFENIKRFSPEKVYQLWESLFNAE